MHAQLVIETRSGSSRHGVPVELSVAPGGLVLSVSTAGGERVEIALSDADFDGLIATRDRARAAAKTAVIPAADLRRATCAAVEDADDDDVIAMVQRDLDAGRTDGR